MSWDKMTDDVALHTHDPNEILYAVGFTHTTWKASVHNTPRHRAQATKHKNNSLISTCTVTSLNSSLCKDSNVHAVRW